MALVPIFSNKLSSDQVLPVPRLIKLGRRSLTSECIAIQSMHRCFSSNSGDKKWQGMHHTTFQNKDFPFQPITEVCIPHALSNEESQETSESYNTEKQVRALESYLNKLHNRTHEQQTSSTSSRATETIPNSETEKEPSPRFFSKTMDLLERNGQVKAMKELISLKDQLGKLNAGLNRQKTFSNFDNETTEEPPLTPNSISGDYEKTKEPKANNYVQLGVKDDELGIEKQDEASDLYLVCVLASINIAVFLFEIASPVRNSSVELFTLPSLYGAKINQSILDGEWWRLVTPMFLHSGILHVALGCWGLLTFGPQVCKRYGPLTFFLIYILGGISGNLTSFIHTPEPTVGGTGPIFAIIGAWLIYQVQNKEVIAKEISESMFRKAITATALGFVLSNFGPIDDWTHLGAVSAGIAYGFLTCPILQLDHASSKNGPEDGLVIVRRYADPCKSIVMFTVFILILSSLFFFLEPQVSTMDGSFV